MQGFFKKNFQVAVCYLVHLVLHSLPVEPTVSCLCHIGKDGVLLEGKHGVGVGLHVGARGNPKEATLGVNGTKDPLLVKPQPGNVVP